MDRIERIAEALRSLDLSAGVTVEGRTFVGPADAVTRLRDLEGIASGLASRDLFALYDRSIAHDGVFEEDIQGSGRYYAYILYELKGRRPRRKRRTSPRPSRISCPSTERTRCSLAYPAG